VTASTWQTVGVVVGLFVSVVTVYYLVKSNIREQVRQREAERERAVTAAKAPLIADNARLSSEVAMLKTDKQRREDIYRAELDRKDQRITELEDRLYGRGGPA
jgi:flagellar biosynthesis/type III secretory pathway M-ring protein FliF/YscJ